MILSGRLADWSVEELLQIMRITARTGSITIETVGVDVVLFFRDGDLVDASASGRMDGGDSQVRIVEAVAALLDAPDGTFDIGNEVSHRAGDPIPVPDLLSAVAIWKDAEADLAATGVLDASALRILHDVDGPMLVDPDSWLAIAEFAGAVTFTELEIRLGRIGAIEVVRALRELGVLQMSAADEPSPIAVSGSELGGDGTAVEMDDDTESFDAEVELSRGEGDEPVGESRPVVPGDEPAGDDPYGMWSAEPGSEAGFGDSGEADEAIEPEDDEEDGEPPRRRQMRSVITPAETTLVPGVLSDIRTRFRQ